MLAELFITILTGNLYVFNVSFHLDLSFSPWGLTVVKFVFIK
jgi:hypothetical protein